MKKKCEKSSQGLAKNGPNAYRANSLSRHSLRESIINMSALLLRIQYQTAVLSKYNFVVWSTKSVFSLMKTGSLHKSLLVCTGPPQAPILNWSTSLTKPSTLGPSFAPQVLERQSTGKLEMEPNKIIVASPIIPERAGPAWLMVWAWRS